MHPTFPAVLVILGVIPGLLTTAQAEEGAADSQLSGAETVAEAQKLVLERDRIGKALIGILIDDEQPDKFRIEAAHALGKLQYLPAIDVLVKHITLKTPREFRFESDPPVDYPLTSALASYKYAAVPILVESFLAEKDPGRGGLLLYPIKISKTSQIALRYLGGRESPKQPDTLYKNNYRDLEELLLEAIHTERARE